MEQTIASFVACNLRSPINIHTAGWRDVLLLLLCFIPPPPPPAHSLRVARADSSSFAHGWQTYWFRNGAQHPSPNDVTSCWWCDDSPAVYKRGPAGVFALNVPQSPASCRWLFLVIVSLLRKHTKKGPGFSAHAHENGVIIRRYPGPP